MEDQEVIPRIILSDLSPNMCSTDPSISNSIAKDLSDFTLSDSND